MINELSQEVINEYASNAQTIDEPKGLDYTQGAKVGKTIPAKWWNWMFRAITQRFIQVYADASNMMQEIKNTILDASMTIDPSLNNQLSTAVDIKSERAINKYISTRKSPGIVWEKMSTTNSNFISIGKASNGVLVGLRTHGDLYYSEDNGNTWSPTVTTENLTPPTNEVYLQNIIPFKNAGSICYVTNNYATSAKITLNGKDWIDSGKRIKSIQNYNNLYIGETSSGTLVKSNETFDSWSEVASVNLSYVTYTELGGGCFILPVSGKGTELKVTTSFTAFTGIGYDSVVFDDYTKNFVYYSKKLKTLFILCKKTENSTTTYYLLKTTDMKTFSVLLTSSNIITIYGNNTCVYFREYSTGNLYYTLNGVNLITVALHTDIKSLKGCNIYRINELSIFAPFDYGYKNLSILVSWYGSDSNVGNFTVINPSGMPQYYHLYDKVYDAFYDSYSGKYIILTSVKYSPSGISKETFYLAALESENGTSWTIHIYENIVMGYKYSSGSESIYYDGVSVVKTFDNYTVLRMQKNSVNTSPCLSLYTNDFTITTLIDTNRKTIVEAFNNLVVLCDGTNVYYTLDGKTLVKSIVIDDGTIYSSNSTSIAFFNALSNLIFINYVYYKTKSGTAAIQTYTTTGCYMSKASTTEVIGGVLYIK